MNKRGQALVEFVLILPLFIFLVMVVYDFGMIYTKKNTLENKSNDILELYRNGKSIADISLLYPDVFIDFSVIDDYEKITISTNIKTITPGLNRVFGNPYKVYSK